MISKTTLTPMIGTSFDCFARAPMQFRLLLLLVVTASLCRQGECVYICAPASPIPATSFYAALTQDQCFTDDYRCRRTAVASANYTDCCSPVLNNLTLERSFGTRENCFSCLGMMPSMNLLLLFRGFSYGLPTCLIN